MVIENPFYLEAVRKAEVRSMFQHQLSAAHTRLDKNYLGNMPLRKRMHKLAIIGARAARRRAKLVLP